MVSGVARFCYMLILTRVARSYHKNYPVSRYLYDLAISGQEKCPGWCCHKMCMVTSGMSICHAQSTTSDARVGNNSDARVCLYVFMCMS